MTDRSRIPVLINGRFYPAVKTGWLSERIDGTQAERQAVRDQLRETGRAVFTARDKRRYEFEVPS